MKPDLPLEKITAPVNSDQWTSATLAGLSPMDSPPEVLASSLVYHDLRHSITLRSAQRSDLEQERYHQIVPATSPEGARGFALRSGRVVGKIQGEDLSAAPIAEEAGDGANQNKSLGTTSPIPLAEMALLVGGDLNEEILRQILASLPADTIILYCVEDENRFSILVLQGAGIARWQSTASPSQIRADVGQFRALIRREAEYPDNESFHSERMQIGQRLHSALIPTEVLLPESGINTIIVIPSPATARLPYAALQDAAGTYLVEKATICYYPSLQLMINKASMRPAWPCVYAVGNPKLDIPGGDLPGAEEEAAVGAHSFDESILITGSDATEDHFWREAHKYSIVHLACHFGVDKDSLLDSAFMLSPGEKHDGLLTIREMLVKKYHWNLMVFSACETGVAYESQSGEVPGFWGASHYLLGEVTPALVTTYWQIDNDATIQFMSLFYSRMTIGDEGRAVAEVQRIFIQSPDRWSRPFYWAGIGFYGVNL